MVKINAIVKNANGIFYHNYKIVFEEIETQPKNHKRKKEKPLKR